MYFDELFFQFKGNYVPCKITRPTHRHGCCDRKNRLTEESYSENSSGSESEGNEQDQEDGRNESLDWMEHRAKQSFRYDYL